MLPAKAIKQQRMPSPHSGMKDSITGSDPVTRSLGNYSKAPPAYMPQPDPTVLSHAGSTIIRGGAGGVKKHPKMGGLGPGPMGAAGANNDYAKDIDQS